MKLEDIKKDIEKCVKRMDEKKYEFIQDIRQAIAKYDSVFIYVDRNNNHFELSDEDDILNKLYENEGIVVFCLVSNRHSTIFANIDPSKIYNFYNHFRYWEPEMICYECESYEDAYHTFFPIHETEKLCYSKKH